MTELYGFSGKKGSGKNYIAQHLFLPYLVPKPSLIVAFADVFKLEGIVIHNLLRDEVFSFNGTDKLPSTRKHLQKLGHEHGRLDYGDDIWIKYMYEKILMYSDRGIERFIITDVRYDNEVEWIKEQGGRVFYIKDDSQRLKDKGYDKHPSENSISDISCCDYIIDNTTHHMTLDVVTKIIMELKI
tara:strand:+ start:4056 stop:4610 length:555 start_codon:yes stop_codon:yes gene_type:complete